MVPPTGSSGDVIFWFRRDLRLADHPALRAAVVDAANRGARVIPLFVVDPALVAPSGANRLAYLYGCLRSLRDGGVPLVIRHGDPAVVLPVLAGERSAAAVYCTADFGPYGRRRDAATTSALAGLGVALHALDSPYVVAPGLVRKLDGAPFKVFTPFSKTWRQLAEGANTAATVHATEVPWSRDADGAAIPDDPSGCGLRAATIGEAAAHERLERFAEHHLTRYDELRNDPSADATSRLSADLKYGTLHPRQALSVLGRGSRAEDVFRSEICWREFYADVLWHLPDSARHALRPGMEAMRVDVGSAADDRLAAWCAGRTGYPLIDAGMRQLLAEGWMHNRVRMATASFLVKDLHIDWRRGARYFMSQLVDGDLASNQHGWQWTAGTGTDAAPYFRVFNPVSQGKKFDPLGDFVRRYVPELRHIVGPAVHEPWLAAADLFDGTPDYPSPIVEHAVERVEALTRYREVTARDGDQTTQDGG